VIISGTPPRTGQVLTATSPTAANWQTPSGGGGTPGGSNGEIQYNNSGAFGGSAATISGAGTIQIPNNQVVQWNGDVGISRYVGGVILFGNGSNGDASALVVANTFRAGFGLNIGVAVLAQGDSSHSGFVEWRNPSNTPIAHMGDDTDYPNLHLTMVGGGTFFLPKTQLSVQLLDGSGAPGTNGQLLSSTGTGTAWVSNGPTVNTQTASYQAVLSDANQLVVMNVASANTFTVPSNGTVAFAVGTTLSVIQFGAGQVTLTAAGGVTINTPSSLTTRAQYSTVSVVQVAANIWVAGGDLT
jgi:hypothetical protein